mgnify:FL=1
MTISNKALSTREEKYAQGRARGLSGTASAVAAGYSAHPGTASVTSARIAAREHVKARIAALMVSDTIDDDRSAYVAKLVELREAALGRGQVAAATRAQELIGKALGVSGQDEASVTIHTALEDASTDQIKSALQSAVDKFGVSAAFKQSDQADQPKPDEGKALH